ncbi:hypothetical protein JG687_00017873 [Phytophthora cactorum]|uniref:Uncharacterized protein n=1 Tax=Phytophthora cactorum TaxID=29920 RepID=A0A8T1TQF8_9STRA|nr:hypothetical protein JG687_00017873 [Phytophthora cactorum]
MAKQVCILLVDESTRPEYHTRPVPFGRREPSRDCVRPNGDKQSDFSLNRCPHNWLCSPSLKFGRERLRQKAHIHDRQGLSDNAKAEEFQAQRHPVLLRELRWSGIHRMLKQYRERHPYLDLFERDSHVDKPIPEEALGINPRRFPIAQIFTGSNVFKIAV